MTARPHVTLTITRRSDLAIVHQYALDNSCWFAVEPLPDDHWHITFKDEGHKERITGILTEIRRTEQAQELAPAEPRCLSSQDIEHVVTWMWVVLRRIYNRYKLQGIRVDDHVTPETMEELAKLRRPSTFTELSELIYHVRFRFPRLFTYQAIDYYLAPYAQFSPMTPNSESGIEHTYALRMLETVIEPAESPALHQVYSGSDPKESWRVAVMTLISYLKYLSGTSLPAPCGQVQEARADLISGLQSIFNSDEDYEPLLTALLNSNCYHTALLADSTIYALLTPYVKVWSCVTPGKVLTGITEHKPDSVSPVQASTDKKAEASDLAGKTPHSQEVEEMEASIAPAEELVLDESLRVKIASWRLVQYIMWMRSSPGSDFADLHTAIEQMGKPLRQPASYKHLQPWINSIQEMRVRGSTIPLETLNFLLYPLVRIDKVGRLKIRPITKQELRKEYVAYMLAGQTKAADLSNMTDQSLAVEASNVLQQYVDYVASHHGCQIERYTDLDLGIDTVHSELSFTLSSLLSRHRRFAFFATRACVESFTLSSLLSRHRRLAKGAIALILPFVDVRLEEHYDCDDISVVPWRSRKDEEVLPAATPPHRDEEKHPVVYREPAVNDQRRKDMIQRAIISITNYLEGRRSMRKLPPRALVAIEGLMAEPKDLTTECVTELLCKVASLPCATLTPMLIDYLVHPWLHVTLADDPMLPSCMISTLRVASVSVNPVILDSELPLNKFAVDALLTEPSAIRIKTKRQICQYRIACELTNLVNSLYNQEELYRQSNGLAQPTDLQLAMHTVRDNMAASDPRSTESTIDMLLRFFYAEFNWEHVMGTLYELLLPWCSLDASETKGSYVLDFTGVLPDMTRRSRLQLSAKPATS